MKREKPYWSPLVSGIFLCLLMTLGFCMRGLDFGTVTIGGMFMVIGLALIAQGILQRRGTYDRIAIRNLAPKIIITVFGACMAGVGSFLAVGMAWQELFVKRHGWSVGLVAVIAFSLPFVVGGSFCLMAGIRGIGARPRDAIADQRKARSYLDVPLRRVMAPKVRGLAFFSTLWWGFCAIGTLVAWTIAPAWPVLLLLAPLVGVGIHLSARARPLLAEHRVQRIHCVRLSSPALYPGGEVTIAYEALRPIVGGKMCAVVTQLDQSIREMRPNEPTDVCADKSAKKVVAKRLPCGSGRFSFRLPKAFYEERIRWELLLRFKLEKGDFVEERFRLPLA